MGYFPIKIVGLPGPPILCLVLFLVSACVDDADACGDRYELVKTPFGKLCVARKDNTDSDTDTLRDTDTRNTDATDSESDTESESALNDRLPTGMGDTCSGPGTCTGEADFCAQLSPNSPGNCTVQNCSLNPDDCPTEYRCFDVGAFDPGAPTRCIPDALF